MLGASGASRHQQRHVAAIIAVSVGSAVERRPIMPEERQHERPFPT
jgi:hypothetical protein